MAKRKGSDNRFPLLRLLYTDDTPATPASGQLHIVAGVDKVLRYIDDDGVLTEIGGGGTGDVATDTIWNAAGDLAVGTGSDTAARLAIGATNGMSLRRVAGAVAWDLPPGHEFDYVEKTSTTNVTSTNSASPDTIITASAVTYDGSTPIVIDFWCDSIGAPTSVQTDLLIVLYDGSSAIGNLGLYSFPSNANAQRTPGYHGIRRLTPSAASHTYSVRAYLGVSGTAAFVAGAGGAGNHMPAFIRQVKA